MPQRKPLDGKATGLMVLLCAIWSLQQIVLKAAAPDMAPTMQIALRSGASAILVLCLLVWKRQDILPRNGLWFPGMVAGSLFAMEYLLVGEGLRYTTASRMVVFLYTAPGFAALGLHWLLPEERLRPVQWAGLFLAFSGIVLAFFDTHPSGMGEALFGGLPEAVPSASSGAEPAAISSTVRSTSTGYASARVTGALSSFFAAADFKGILFGDMLGLLAGAAWGATTVVVRTTKLADIPATQTVLYQLVAAFFILLPASFFLGQTAVTWTPTVVGSLAFQTLIVSFASMLAWFWLLRTYLASRLGVLAFMTPVLGIVFGVLLLGENAEPRFVAGSILVVAGIVVVSWKRTVKTGS